MFIAVFTKSSSYPYIEVHQSSLRPITHIITWKYILILSSHLRLGFPNGFLLSGFSSKTPDSHLLTTHHVLLDLINRIILWYEHKSWSSSLCSLLHSLHLVPPRRKYLPQHPILKHPQPKLLPQCYRPILTCDTPCILIVCSYFTNTCTIFFFIIHFHWSTCFDPLGSSSGPS